MPIVPKVATCETLNETRLAGDERLARASMTASCADATGAESVASAETITARNLNFTMRLVLT